MDTDRQIPPPLSSYILVKELDQRRMHEPTLDQLNTFEEQVKSTLHISGANLDLTLSIIAIVIPTLGLSFLLIGLIISRRVHTHQSSGPLDFTQRNNGDSSAYYVDINATSLAIIASWSSTITPLLALALMTLASFPIAKRLQRNSASGAREEDLPTPYQLLMLYQTLTGQMISFWTLLLYRKWDHRLGKLPTIVRASFGILVLTLLLSAAVAAFDTWLHLAITTVELDVVSARQPQGLFGRDMANGECASQSANNLDFQNCTIKITNPPQGTSYWLVGANEAYWTLTNLSTINSVGLMNKGTQTFAYLAPAVRDPQIDYVAHTMAIGTECQPISKRCNLKVDTSGDEPFNCSGGFSGDLSVPQVNGIRVDRASGTGISFFTDETLTRNASLQTAPQNPYYLGVWAVLELEPSPEQLIDGEVVQSAAGGSTWLLSCTTTAYEMNYAWVRGVVADANFTKANATMTAFMNSPASFGFGESSFGSIAYAASAENSSQTLADSWAKGYSATVIGLSSGFMSPQQNQLEQKRDTRLVARVPKAPLYTLISFNFLYFVIALGLFYLAKKSNPREINDVRARLTVRGLVASAFEGDRSMRQVDESKKMFAEHNREDPGRIAMERSAHGGWQYVRRTVTR